MPRAAVNAIAVTLGVTAATIYRVLSDDQAKHAGEQNPTSSLWWIRDVKKPCHIDYTAALDLPLIVDGSEHNLSFAPGWRRCEEAKTRANALRYF